MDLNKILSLWPYLLGALAIGGLYVPDVWRWVAAWRAGKAAAPTVATTPAGEPAAVPVGTLAEYLKAIANHCRKVNDTAALGACDEIAPTLFHEPAAPKPDASKPAAA